MSLRLLVFVLLVCVACPLTALADGEVSPIRQVSYKLRIVEMSNSDVKILGGTLPDPIDFLDVGISSITRLIHSPGLTTLLQSASSLLQVTATHVKEDVARVAEPHLAVSVGETGKFSLVHDEWIANNGGGTLSERHYGLELLLTPVRLDERGEAVLTEVALSTAAPDNQLLTTVWAKTGEVEAIGIMSYQTRMEQNGLWNNREKAETRYFAVYLEVQPITLLSEHPSVNMGSLGGLPTLLWTKGVQLRPSMVQVSVPVIPLERPELDVSLRLTEQFQVELATENQHYHLDVGTAIGGQELTVNLQLLRDLGINYLALGVADRVDINPSITLSAGFYPMVVDLAERRFARGGYWWGEIELAQGNFYGSARFTKRPARTLWQGTVGCRWTPEDMVFVSYKTDSEDLRQVFIGYRREF